MKWKSLFAIGILCGLAGSASAVRVPGSIYSPVGATVDSGGTADPTNSPIDRTIDQSGLFVTFESGRTDFYSYTQAASPSPKHSYVARNEWFSAEGESSATVTFDLGQLLSIDRLALWNEDDAGIGVLVLSFSTDGTTFTPPLDRFSPTNNPSTQDYLPQIFSFSSVRARYVQFVMSDCPQLGGGFRGCGIGEVAFRITPNPTQQVPEPATLALFGIGLAGVGALRRRRG